jgi:hypothetical protein
MEQEPVSAVEAHLEVRVPAEGTAQEHSVSARHVAVGGVGGFRAGVVTDPVRGAAGANEEAEREWLAFDAGTAAGELGAGERVGKTLRLLQRKHPQRETAPAGNAMCFAAHPVVQTGEDDDAQVGLGLAAAGGEPERVDDAPLGARGVDERREGREQEAQLEWAPAFVAAGAGMHERFVCESERPERALVVCE